MGLTNAGIQTIERSLRDARLDLDGVRCRNPKCRAKLGEKLHGTLVVTCRKCGLQQTIEVFSRD